MAVNLSQKKSDALSSLVALTPDAFELAAKIQELVAYVTDNGFLTGGSSPILDADCVGENAHMDAALFNSAITAISSVSLSTGNKTTLRKTSKKPLPF